MPKQLTFDGVKGYASRQFAQARGQKLEKDFASVEFRWVIITLPSGRYAPMIILNDSIPGGPGMFLGQTNVCMAN